MKKLLLILLLPLSVYSQSRKSTIDSCVVMMHKLVNEHRIKNGKSSLILSDSLTKLAQARAEYMYKTGEYNHVKGVFNENAGSGMDFDRYFELSYAVSQEVYGYSKSPGHNKNMLFQLHTAAGYGFYKGYSVQLFEF